MRKIISLSLLALLFSLLSGQALAGKNPDCEAQKQELKALGLYGLCNAYYSAKNENARDRILINYNNQAELVGGPPMPGLEPEDPGDPPPPPPTECPCWTADSLRQSLAVASEAYTCEVSDGFVYADYQVGNIQFSAGDSGFGNECLFANFGDDFAFDLQSIDPDENEVCIQNVIDLIAAGDFPVCD